MSRTVRNLAPSTEHETGTCQRSPRYSETRAAAQRDARAMIADALADVVTAR